MGALIRAKDWSRTAIGPTDTWPQSLRTALGICLASRFPMLIWWGPELTVLYNDAYIPMFGNKHPWALGRVGPDARGEVWDVIGPMLDRVIACGEASWSEDMFLALRRFGFAEEAYFTWSYSPIVDDETGRVGGAFTAVTETTRRVISERRFTTLRALADHLADPREIDVACKLALDTIGDNLHDFAFAALYLVDDGERSARRAARTPNLVLHPAFPSSLSIEHEDWPIAAVLRSGRPQLAVDLSTKLGTFPPGIWPEPPRSAAILPVARAGGRPRGVLITGISPRLAFDDAYRGFYDLVAGSIGSALSAATPRAEDKRRAEMRAELDRTQASLFSSLGHELSPVPGSSGEPGRPPAAQPLGDRDARLLIADDNENMRDYLQRVLGERWRVTVAPDGACALAAAQRARPDLIVTDVVMPNLDGFGLLRALRADPTLATVPVVLLSARAGEEERIEGIDAGADVYLIKPFSARELIARVSNLLQLSRLRREVELERNRLAMFVQQTPVAVSFWEGPEFRCRLYNDAYARIVRRPIRLGTPIVELLPEIRGTESLRRCELVFHDGASLDVPETRFLFHDAGGAEREGYFKISLRPLRDADGAISGITSIALDITDQVLARRAVEQSRSEAIAANRAKDEFLAMLGHELRNPLAPILTALELMRLRASDVLTRERAIIERQTHHLAAMLEDLLDVSRITRGMIQLRREQLPLADVLAKAIETAAPVFEQQRHELVVDVPGDIAVEVDAARMTQVFANLLTNAAKYTDPGGRVTVAAATQGGEAVVTVTDTGRGIAPDMLPHVFDLFVQERQNLDRSRGGLGLGLAIVRSLVQLHGGRVQVASPGPGRGATFTVWLPSALDAHAGSSTDAAYAPPALDRPERRATSVLVVDDNVDAATLLADLLESHGYTTRVAHDAPQVLELAHDFVPDVALLDIGLPAMDGCELAHRLRALPNWCNVRLRARTGYGQTSDRTRSQEAGFDHHLVKPISFAMLESLLPAVPR